MTSALQLHDQAMTVAKDLKAKYIELFEVLLEIEMRKAYQQFEVVSLHAYCVQLLELSDNIANDFVQVVRKAITVPKLADAVLTKQVSISKARKICPVITVQSADEWIAVASENTCRVIEKTVATANPRTAVYETMRYVSADILEFKLAVSEEWEAALKETKDLLSQKHSRAVSSEEALLILMKSFCESESPIRKAERAKVRREKMQERTDGGRGGCTPAARSRTERASAERSGAERSGTKRSKHEQTVVRRSTLKNESDDNYQACSKWSSSHQDSRSRHRPAEVEQLVDLRDQCQCVHVMPNGKRCTEKRWLQKHHMIEFADGGEHTPENLETLCFVHHKIRHPRRSAAEFRVAPRTRHDAPSVVT